MYRIIRPSKDTYIQNKSIKKRRATKGNTGNAGTIDLYSLYNESNVYDDNNVLETGSIREHSRALIKFEYDKILEMDNDNFIDLSIGNYTCSLKMFDVYGGQTTPSNFELEILPLAKPFSEGRGSDVIYYAMSDAANWITASLSGSQASLWDSPGASATGSFGDLNIDVYVSNSIDYIGIKAFFERGDENLSVDITSLVSSSLANEYQNEGFRIAFTEEEEQENKTYFVKRFGTKQSQNPDLRPRIDIETTDDIIRNDKIRAKLSPFTQSFFVFNTNELGYQNFNNNGSDITGNNCLLLELTTEKFVKTQVTTYSLAHNMTISYMSRSLATYTASFTASQFMIGTKEIPGIYYAPVVLDPYQDSVLYDYLSGSIDKQITFTANWRNIANLQSVHKEEIIVGPYEGYIPKNLDTNYIVNIYNLKSVYSKKAKTFQRFRVYVQNYNTEVVAYRYPYTLKSEVVPGTRFRIKKAFQNVEYIPFCAATELSYDDSGMYFDLYMSDFDSGNVYEVELVMPSGNASKNDVFIQNPGWRFKVVD